MADQIHSQWAIVQDRFGKPIGIELVKREKISDSFLRYYYLLKFEKHAISWRFTYYNAKNGWQINSITFQDEVDILFEPIK